MTKRNDDIRRLNDELRTDPLQVSNVLLSAGVSGLGEETADQIMQKVREFDDFTKDNDPDHEHDFGSFEFGEHHINWKIDYYHLDLKYGSEDTSDPTKTTRILIVMLAEEY